MVVGGGQVYLLMATHTSMCVFESLTYSAKFANILHSQWQCLQTFYTDNGNVCKHFTLTMAMLEKIFWLNEKSAGIENLHRISSTSW